jgi:type III secretory pathway component EscU
MVLSYNRSTSYALFITTILVLEMVLIIEHIKPTNADFKKLKIKKALKKLAPLISLLQLLKSKKKVIPIPLPLPLPIPM